jgi:hypothetical protein
MCAHIAAREHQSGRGGCCYPHNKLGVPPPFRRAASRHAMKRPNFFVEVSRSGGGRSRACSLSTSRCHWHDVTGTHSLCASEHRTVGLDVEAVWMYSKIVYRQRALEEYDDTSRRALLYRYSQRRRVPLPTAIRAVEVGISGAPRSFVMMSS